MRFMVMVRADAQTEAGVMPEEGLLKAMGEYNQALVEAGVMKGGEGLQPSARGARVVFDAKGSRVVDGPISQRIQ